MLTLLAPASCSTERYRKENSAAEWVKASVHTTWNSFHCLPPFRIRVHLFHITSSPRQKEFGVLRGWGSWTVCISLSEDLLGIQSLWPHASPTKAEFGGTEPRKHGLLVIYTRSGEAKRPERYKAGVLFSSDSCVFQIRAGCQKNNAISKGIKGGADLPLFWEFVN